MNSYCLSTASSDIDYNQHSIVLKPEDSEYVRSVNEGHQVTCQGGGDDANIKWLGPGGTEIASKGRVHSKLVEGLNLLKHEFEKFYSNKYI